MQLVKLLIYDTLKLYFATFCHDHDTCVPNLINDKQLEFFQSHIVQSTNLQQLESNDMVNISIT